ncbi:hypothetical protein E4T50_00675 [Aureobasidium sp. EXF-12298]|nr:hypothetical protein E4T50_00675 [Aureobasidium sp. EXF-12298]
MPRSRQIQASSPVDKYFPSDSLVIGAGVTIFHLATSRIVICKDTRNGVFFLPKGRKDASEETTITAIREGYEESGYRCRLLPLPVPHLQPSPTTLNGNGTEQSRWVIEPLATRMMPVATEYQYLLFWYAAETISEDEEKALNAAVSGDGFIKPEPFSGDTTLKRREAMDMREQGIYEPKRHEGTGVDEDEAFYVGMLVGIEEAVRLLGGTSADVVRRAWEGVCLRRKMEEKTVV